MRNPVAVLFALPICVLAVVPAQAQVSIAHCSGATLNDLRGTHVISTQVSQRHFVSRSDASCSLSNDRSGPFFIPEDRVFTIRADQNGNVPVFESDSVCFRLMAQSGLKEDAERVCCKLRDGGTARNLAPGRLLELLSPAFSLISRKPTSEQCKAAMKVRGELERLKQAEPAEYGQLTEFMSANKSYEVELTGVRDILLIQRMQAAAVAAGKGATTPADRLVIHDFHKIIIGPLLDKIEKFFKSALDKAELLPDRLKARDRVLQLRTELLDALAKSGISVETGEALRRLGHAQDAATVNTILAEVREFSRVGQRNAEGQQYTPAAAKASVETSVAAYARNLTAAATVEQPGTADTPAPADAGKLKSTRIGTQVWQAENLSVTTFRNGVPIRKVTTPAEWVDAVRNKQPAYMEAGDNYGNAYNVYAIHDLQGLGPAGWRMPTQADYDRLKMFLTGWADPASTMGNAQNGPKLRAPSQYWIQADGGDLVQGTNETGFGALPAGYVEADGHLIKNKGNVEYWTTTTAKSRSPADGPYKYGYPFCLGLYDKFGDSFGTSWGSIGVDPSYQDRGRFVRLIKDE